MVGRYQMHFARCHEISCFFIDGVPKKFELEGLIASELEKTSDYDILERPKNEEIVPGNENTKVLELNQYSKSNIIINSSECQNIEELDMEISNKFVKTSAGFQCLVCNKIQKTSGHMREHVEIHFEGLHFNVKFVLRAINREIT